MRIRPMRVGESAALLGLISLLGLACFYGLRPALERAGWASYPAYLVSLSVVFAILLVWSALAYLAWAVGLVLLFPVCKAFEAFKHRMPVASVWRML